MSSSWLLTSSPFRYTLCWLFTTPMNSQGTTRPCRQGGRRGKLGGGWWVMGGGGWWVMGDGWWQRVRERMPRPGRQVQVGGSWTWKDQHTTALQPASALTPATQVKALSQTDQPHPTHSNQHSHTQPVTLTATIPPLSIPLHKVSTQNTYFSPPPPPPPTHTPGV